MIAVCSVLPFALFFPMLRKWIFLIILNRAAALSSKRSLPFRLREGHYFLLRGKEAWELERKIVWKKYIERLKKRKPSRLAPDVVHNFRQSAKVLKGQRKPKPTLGHSPSPFCLWGSGRKQHSHAQTALVFLHIVAAIL